jgi:hypothetical protein
MQLWTTHSYPQASHLKEEWGLAETRRQRFKHSTCTKRIEPLRAHASVFTHAQRRMRGGSFRSPSSCRCVCSRRVISVSFEKFFSDMVACNQPAVAGREQRPQLLGRALHAEAALPAPHSSRSQRNQPPPHAVTRWRRSLAAVASLSSGSTRLRTRRARAHYWVAVGANPSARRPNHRVAAHRSSASPSDGPKGGGQAAVFAAAAGARGAAGRCAAAAPPPPPPLSLTCAMQHRAYWVAVGADP